MLEEQDVNRVVLRTLDLMNAQAVKEFRLPPDTYIGAGAIACIGEALAARGIRTVFIVIDSLVADLGLAEGMYRSLTHHGVRHREYFQPAGEPHSAFVEEEVGRFVESGCEGMIALGGGSAIDAAKAIAVLAANPGLAVRDLLDPARIRNRRLPLIAAPTTAGTGSEATSITVITDTHSHHKQVIVHPDLTPDLALIDACLMLPVPPRVTAATGVDALTHSIEAYVATKATPLTRALAYQAIRQIGEALPVAVGRGDDVQARESMALASYMAGVAFSNAGLGLTHSMAHQIGPRYNLPHGIANAILLPSVMRFNQLVRKKDFCDIGLALTGEILSADETVDAVQRLIADVGLPVNLAEVGGNAEDFAAFAEEALSDYCIATNPRAVSREQVMAVYSHALHRKNS
ncbi:MAG: iron-containing alcohol dehydrogenase [Deltaproteobacteria bacterium]|jgi:alcohol dehydrogenase|nr:iron-containing alcohol dehydrogenase [Deltaproteobacteria bacterium]